MDNVELAIMALCGGGAGGGGPVAIPLAQRASLGLPTLDTTAITDSLGNTNTLAKTTKIFDWIGPSVSKMRIVFGRKQDVGGNWAFPTLPITDDGSTGSGKLKLLNFPKGIVAINGGYANLPLLIGVSGGNWTMTTGVMSVGSAAAATDATLTSTEADIIGSTALNVLTYSSNVPAIGAAVSGAKTASVAAIFTNNDPATIAALLDSTGGTAAATLTTVVTGATVTPNTQNNFSSLAAQIELIRAKIDGQKSVRFDGTATALSVYLNFGVNSDPGAAQNIALGYIAAGSETVRPAGYIDILYSYRSGNSGSAIFDVPPPMHGAGSN